jgi:hypothetical protein
MLARDPLASYKLHPPSQTGNRRQAEPQGNRATGQRPAAPANAVSRPLTALP